MLFEKHICTVHTTHASILPWLLPGVLPVAAPDYRDFWPATFKHWTLYGGRERWRYSHGRDSGYHHDMSLRASLWVVGVIPQSVLAFDCRVLGGGDGFLLFGGESQYCRSGDLGFHKVHRTSRPTSELVRSRKNRACPKSHHPRCLSPVCHNGCQPR